MRVKLKENKASVIALMLFILYCIAIFIACILDKDPASAAVDNAPTTSVSTKPDISHEMINIEIPVETEPEVIIKPKPPIFEMVTFEPPVEQPEEVWPEEPIVRRYQFGRRMTPSLKINYENGVKNHTEKVDTSGYKYVGRYRITGYTPKCKHCCGSDKGICASGVEAIVGYSVATGSEFKFGTTLYIKGYGYYVVEDRGNLGKNVIDIACPDHETCYAITYGSVDVYVVPNKFDKK